jgi:short-subunit dehydrogenase involved in D-alanine esterification of teichoic acids
MPTRHVLKRFIGKVLKILKIQPTPAEICVNDVKGIRFAAESAHFDAIFNGLNASMADVH